MDVQALIDLVRKERATLLPFIGSGMTASAGAPSAWRLARDLAHQIGLDDSDETDLAEVTARAEARVGVDEVRHRLASIVTGWRLRPTPALRALCGTPGQRLLTTNYDDGIERSARDRGLVPVSLLPTDPQILKSPAPHEVHVVHLHGLPDKPGSLVLPGATTEELGKNEVFQTFVRSRLAPQGVVYLGFSFDRGEVHLHRIAEWLSRHVDGAGRHYVLLPDDELHDVGRFDGYDSVTVVDYRKDPERTEVERVAVAFAPRSSDTSEAGEVLTWVSPVLMRVEGDDEERLQQRLLGFDSPGGASRDVVSLPEVLEHQRVLFVAGPGMGKSTLLERLPPMVEPAPAATASLADFRPASEGDPRELAIARLLSRVGESPAPLEMLDGPPGLVTLDGLDEVGEGESADVVQAVVAAAAAWPQHVWAVSSRPHAATAQLRDEGFAEVRLMSSRRWAERYLETRSVPPERIRHAMLDGYGLGDLMTIPLFAERLADRLLEDRTADPSPLELLIDEQYAATAREAERSTQRSADLGAWMQALAVALELRGRASADVAELETMPGPAGVSGRASRERLVKASVLADRPGVAAFPRKALQEGLCAQGILEASDPLNILVGAAVAEIDGRPRLRDDIELTLDLVFEHAQEPLRSALRRVDEQRWARTVVTCGGTDEAHEAYRVMEAWHADRDMPFSFLGEGGLRTAAAAVRAIVRRWPAVAEERRGRLEMNTRSASVSVCERALATLGALPLDERTSKWLLPCLEDDRRRVVLNAAQLAGRLGVKEAIPSLQALLDSRQEHVADVALRALVELVDVSELPALIQASPYDGLRLVAERVLERVDLDTGLAVVQRAGLDDSGAWLLNRLLEDAHPGAWNADRVEALMRACASSSLDGPDMERISAIFARHPDRAIASVSLTRIEGRPWGEAAQLLPLSRLSPDDLAGDEHVELRSAIARATEEESERRARDEQPARDLQRLVSALEERGLDLDLAAVEGVHQLGTLPDRSRQVLGELVTRWWPTDEKLTEAALNDESDGAERLLRVVAVGAQIDAPLRPSQWEQLLIAHLGVPHWMNFDLGAHSVTAWLIKTRPADSTDALMSQIASARDGDAVSKIFAIAGRPGPASAITAAVIARLRALEPDSWMWGNAVGLLIEAGCREEIRDLLDVPLSDEARNRIARRLAAAGDQEAQARVLAALTQALSEGLPVEVPHWHDDARTVVPIEPLARLAQVALAYDHQRLRSFALGLLESREDVAALAELSRLRRDHHARHPWLALSVERLARRLATQQVLARLPRDLGALARWFAERSPME